MAKQEPVPVSGIWLRSRGTDIEVLVEREGQWYVVIEEYGNSISHIVEPLGILKGKPDPVCERSWSVPITEAKGAQT